VFQKLKNNLKVLEFADFTKIQKVISDELKKIQKEEFSAAFQKMYDCAEACIYVELILN